MHESHLIRDLMSRVEQEIAASPKEVQRLKFRVGALSGIAPAPLQEGAAQYASDNWGHVPEIEVEESTDPADPNALGVMLVSIGVRT